MTSKIVIFEGVDCAGKTTLAKEYAKQFDYMYIHLGPFKHISEKTLARIYLDVMLPALNGLRNTVFDRSWYSEYPYAKVLRDGQDRIGPVRKRMLDKFAAKCNAVIVLCDPGIDVILNNYSLRKDDLIEHKHEIEEIYNAYNYTEYGLPMIKYDYRIGFGPQRAIDINNKIEALRNV